MKVMILAAGRGRRLAPLTDTVPKPMLPVAGKPLIQWQIEALARAGAKEIIINLHHLGAQIADHLGDGATFGLAISYSWEDQLLETGGGIVNALPFFDDEPFWLLNGDIWTDFDFATLSRQLDPPNLAHIVLTPTPAYRDAGDFEFSDGQVTARGQSYVYCGIALLAPELFHGLTPGHFSLRDVYFDLIAAGALSGQVHPGQWQDIGTLDEYNAINSA